MNMFSGYEDYMSPDRNQPVDNLDYVHDGKLPDGLPILSLNTDQAVDSQQAETLLNTLRHILSLMPVFKPPVLHLPSPLSGNPQVNQQITEILKMHPETQPPDKDRVDVASQTVNLPVEIPYQQTCYYSIPPAKQTS